MVSNYLSWRALSGSRARPDVEIFVAAFNKDLGMARDSVYGAFGTFLCRVRKHLTAYCTRVLTRLPFIFNVIFI